MWRRLEGRVNLGIFPSLRFSIVGISVDLWLLDVEKKNDRIYRIIEAIFVR